jgi:tetratricopeptide (TPR) repeat protein
MRLLFALLFLSTGGLILAEPASDFANANREYAAGHFQAATEGYEALARSGQWNATLFYNLGNAWYRRGNPGRAILNYERALALEPHHAEATANLRIVRDQARALELTQPWPERFLASVSLGTYAWMAATTFWLGMFALAAFLFRRSSAAAFAVTLALLTCGCTLYAIYRLENGNRGPSLAIVTGKNTEARLATADNANTVLALPPGSEIKILSMRGDWSYAALPNNLRGWIPARSAELVRM